MCSFFYIIIDIPTCNPASYFVYLLELGIQLRCPLALTLVHALSNLYILDSHNKLLLMICKSRRVSRRQYTHLVRAAQHGGGLHPLLLEAILSLELCEGQLLLYKRALYITGHLEVNPQGCLSSALVSSDRHWAILPPTSAPSSAWTPPETRLVSCGPWSCLLSFAAQPAPKKKTIRNAHKHYIWHSALQSLQNRCRWSETQLVAENCADNSLA